MEHFKKQMEYPQTTGFLGRARASLTSTVAVFGLSAFLAVGAVLLGGSPANAWGPTRQTFTMKNPSDHVTFNSITDDQAWGDERTFTLIKDVTNEIGQDNSYNGAVASAGDFKEVADAANGHTYMVKMFVHNNAAANLNLVAKNTRVMAYMPTAAGDSAQIQGMIAADNCGANTKGATGSPCTFWDEAYIKGAGDTQSFQVAPVPNSMRYFNNIKGADTDGFTLDQSNLLNTTGVKVGYNQMDGNVQGCFDYSGYVTFLVKVVAQQSDFTLTKQLRINGGQWAHTGVAKPGDTIEYALTYQNIGQNNQANVILRDTLAKNITILNQQKKDDNTFDFDGNTAGNALGLSYINGSTYVAAGAESPINQKDDSWTAKGLNIGTYAPNGGAIVTYKTTVPSEDQLQCGQNIFENTVIATTEAGSKLATTQVSVNRDCSTTPDTPNPAPTPENPTVNNAKTPGAPNAGAGIKTAVISLGLFLACAAVMVYGLMKKKTAKK